MDGWLKYADTEWFERDPKVYAFTISNSNELAGLAKLVNVDGKNMAGITIMLGNNIALNDTILENWYKNTAGIKRWTAIGSDNVKFQGTFNGNGYFISGVYIDNVSNDQGLFGYVECGIIKYLGVSNSYIKGVNNVGSLVGKNSHGIIAQCYVKGIVSGTEKVGGLVGLNASGTISNCYTRGLVSGNKVGGLVGTNIDSTISNSYASAKVHSENTNVGGLVGNNENTNGNLITKCFYNKDSSGQTKGVGNCEDCENIIESKTNAEMKDKDTYIMKEWDFDDTWTMDMNGLFNIGMPYLRWQDKLVK